MSDVMKQLENIEFIEMAGKDGVLLTMKDIKWLGGTIKRLHAENERYKQQLTLIRKDTYCEDTDYISIKHVIRKRADKALAGERK